MGFPEDPRILAARKNLAGVKLAVPVVSPKGGVGKTTVSTMLSLLLCRTGAAVGLLDLDITNPTAHIMLGARPGETLPEEEKGIIPPLIHGVRFMSPIYYSRENPLVLRGAAITDAIRELLAITRWGALDVLLMDMPPGLSDEMLEAMLLSPKLQALLVSTQSVLSIHSVERIVRMLRDSGTPILGLVENMAFTRHSPFTGKYGEMGLRLLAVLPFEPGVEEAVGRPEALLDTGIAEELGRSVAPWIMSKAETGE